MPAISFCRPFFWTTQLSQHQINQPFCISSGSQEVLLTLPPLACTFSTNRGPVFCISRMTFLFKVLYADMPAISFCRPFFWTTQLIQLQINQPFCISSGSQEVLLTLPPLACWSWPQAHWLACSRQYYGNSTQKETVASCSFTSDAADVILPRKLSLEPAPKYTSCIRWWLGVDVSAHWSVSLWQNADSVPLYAYQKWDFMCNMFNAAL